jgi:uncharacterized protein YqjF (DUF2071 family)
VLATARLERVALVAFEVSAERLAAVLPDGVEPDRLEPRGQAVLSVVTFLAHNLGVQRVPRWRVECGHLDYRAHVRFRGERAVWFLGAAMDSWLASALRWTWGMPWHRAAVDITADDDRYRLVARDKQGAATVHLATVAEAVPSSSPFDPDELVRVVVNPPAGLYEGRRHRIRRYTVDHRPLTPARAAGTVRFPVLEGLGLLAPTDAPAAAFRLPDFDIAISLPPRRTMPARA